MSGSIGRATCAISPSGLRTATAQLRGPRIITPSRTAWPPMAWLMGLVPLRASPRGPLGFLEPPLETLDAAARVQQLLLPGVERVALRANLDVQHRLRRTRLERVPARAVHGRENVLGMDLGLHRAARIAEAIWPPTLPPETTQTGARASIFPASHAAAATAPAGSQASFARW